MAITEQRLRLILTELQRHNRVSVNALADSLTVSTETIRRDLKELEARGEARRVYGGAVVDRKTEQPFAERRRVQAPREGEDRRGRGGARHRRNADLRRHRHDHAGLRQPGRRSHGPSGPHQLDRRRRRAGSQMRRPRSPSPGARSCRCSRRCSARTPCGPSNADTYDLAIMSIGTVHADHGFMDRRRGRGASCAVSRGAVPSARSCWRTAASSGAWDASRPLR